MPIEKRPTDLDFKNPKVRALVCSAFPGAKTRRPVRVSTSSSYHVEDYWDGGSRTYTAFVELATGRALTSESLPRSARQMNGNPYNLPVGDIELGEGFVVVEHVIFCGKDLGYRIVVGQTDADKLPCVDVPALPPPTPTLRDTPAAKALGAK